MDRQNEIVSLLRAINENLPEGGGGATYEAGQNIDITDNKIAAKGYFYNDEKKEELKAIDDVLHEAGLPSQMSLGLKVSGAAGATTYTWSDDMDGMFAQLIQYGMLPGVGATYQTANGKSGVIAAVDATTITFEETLDAENALTDESVPYVVDSFVLNSLAEGVAVEVDLSFVSGTISGAAGATTYSFTFDGELGTFVKPSYIIKLGNGESAEVVSIDDTNHTITVKTTFDANNALSDELIAGYVGKNIASGIASHAEGGAKFEGAWIFSTAIGAGSHAEGASEASGMVSHAEGVGAEASGMGSHAEGSETTASGQYSHAEGIGTTASGMDSHAEGRNTSASGNYSHAEGNYSVASGDCSHAEGGNINGVVYKTEASGSSSHAEGLGTEASGDCSHAEGVYTYTQNRGEHAEGRNNRSHQDDSSWNAHSAGNTIHSVGIGRSETSSGRGNGVNALEIMQSGDIYVYGVGGYQGTDTKVQDATIKTLQEYIASLESRIAALEGS